MFQVIIRRYDWLTSISRHSGINLHFNMKCHELSNGNNDDRNRVFMALAKTCNYKF